MEDIPIRKNPYRVPGFSFGSRIETEINEESTILGPGSYNVNYESPKKQAISFSKSKRFESLEKKSYSETKPDVNSPNSLLLKTITDPKKNLGAVSNSISFSKAPKTSIFSVPSLTLGPGQYSVKRDFEGSPNLKKSSPKTWNDDPHSKSAKLIKSYVIKDSPGPGQYSPIINLSAGHKDSGFSIGSSQRQFNDPKVIIKQGLSGKEYYKYSNFNHIGKGSPKLSFPKDERRDISPSKNIPGPGSYRIDQNSTQDKSKQKGTFGHAPRKIHGSVKELELGPGPGEYDLVLDSYKKGIKMSGSVRPEMLVKKGIPGPGEYDILTEFERKKKEIDKVANMTKSRTLAKLKTQVSNEFDSPAMKSRVGPTEEDTIKDYMNTSNSPNKSRKKTNISSWIEFAIKTSISPGPKYLVENQSIEKNMGHVGTTFSNFYQKGSINESNMNSPGPGWYDDLYREKDNSPISFAQSKRKENPLLPEHTLGIPGPDHYDPLLAKSIVGGAFTQAQRHLETQEKEKKSVSPPKRRQVSVL